MFDADLPPDLEKLQQGAIEFARNELGGSRVSADRDEQFDRAGWNACGRCGVFGLPVPETYGGLGLGLTALPAVMEGLGYATRDHGSSSRSTRTLDYQAPRRRLTETAKGGSDRS